MRIIAGKFKGRKLVKSDHLKSLRPTTDMAREALFNILASGKFINEISFDINGANILDVCAGSGAVAFEALSRGAKFATLIEKDRGHIEIIRSNAKVFDVENQIKILNYDAKKLPKNSEFFDLIFIDPPYEDNYKEIIEKLCSENWIKQDSLVVIEHDSIFNKKGFDIGKSLKFLDLRSYGKTSFSFFTL